ncbi:MAG: DUF5368 domain-containing protein [Paracoccaceae bacterium]|nr:MAG: DUF5368 domain-containing protein [Paracoccaceae bacterium]
MKDLTLGTLIAVFEEMFGRGLFWALVAAAVLVTVAFLAVLWRDRGIAARRLVRAELFAPLGAVAGVVFVFWITNSGLRDIGGPIDVVILIAIAAAGAVGLTILAYTAQALIRGTGR